jgi:hypothetical protein
MVIFTVEYQLERSEFIGKILAQSTVAITQTSSASLKSIKSIKNAHKRGIKISWHAINYNQLLYNVEGLISITMKEISLCYSIQSISVTKSKSKVKATKKQTQSHFRFSFSMPIINPRPSFLETFLTLLFESENHILGRHRSSN